MSEPEHALLAPSGAGIWAPEGGCRAYPQMAERYPETSDGLEAREGTAAHWYVSETLSGRVVTEGMLAPNGEPITGEMVDCAVDVIADVRDTLAANPGAELWVESRLYMPVVDPQNWGTPDYVVVNRATQTVFVWDFKYGHGFVDAVENWQLLDYLVGVLSQVAGAPQYWTGWKAVLTVAQPRNYHPLGSLREWRVTGEKLAAHYLPRFKQSAAESLADAPVATTGDHCRYCPARHACAALLASGQLSVDVSRQSAPVELSPAALGLELRQIEDAIKRLEARQTGLEAQALGLIRAGGQVPHYGTEHAIGREKWIKPPADVFLLGTVLGANLRKPESPVTPKQARDALAKIGVDGSVIATYAEKPRGGLRLVRVKDSAARLAFE